MVKKYAQVTNQETKACNVGLGSDSESYIKMGFELLDVEQAYNGCWYLKGYCPQEPLEEQLQKLESRYNMPRVIREGILTNPSMYSEFNVLRARELETIAEQIRVAKEGK